MKGKVENAFYRTFGSEGTVYSSGGRINLIGEHTDYNGGFVLPGAIDKRIMAMISKNNSDIIRVYSADLDEYAEFGMREEDRPKPQWARYIFGVSREIQKRGGEHGGFNAAFAGNIPLGAGMSSSAALESTFAFAVNDMWDLNIDKFELARIGQATEHNYCGVRCGIMDQFASLFGKEGNLIRLDCRSLEYKYFPFNPEGYKLVLLDTKVKHELASSAYNNRRESCERAAKAMGVDLLREAGMEDLLRVKHMILPEDFTRAGYVINEIQRVLEVCNALERNDFETVGERMYETHKGMSELYEVSCPELDFLNNSAREYGVTGSRVMGGGFGGCTLNLVKNDRYDNFITRSMIDYKNRFGYEPSVYDVVISDGACKE